MKNPSQVLLAAFVASPLAAQQIPCSWDREGEWVDQLPSDHNTTNGNPAADSTGELVWNYEYIWVDVQSLPFYKKPRAAAVWWYVLPWWTNIWVAPSNTAARVGHGYLMDPYDASFTHNNSRYKPVVRLENIHDQPITLDVFGTLNLSWNGSTVAVPVTVDVVFAVRDDSAGPDVVNAIYEDAFDKPTPTATPESVDIPIDLRGITLDPSDSLLWTFGSQEGTGEIAWLTLDDSQLEIQRVVSAQETIRQGLAPNPEAFEPGQTSSPVIASTWDPIIDHTTFLPTATVDAAVVSLAPTDIALPPFGTLLCDLTPPVFWFFATPGNALEIPVPDKCGLVGLEICAQGMSSDGVTTLFTNAIDATIGTY